MIEGICRWFLERQGYDVRCRRNRCDVPIFIDEAMRQSHLFRRIVLTPADWGPVSMPTSNCCIVMPVASFEQYPRHIRENFDLFYRHRAGRDPIPA